MRKPKITFDSGYTGAKPWVCACEEFIEFGETPKEAFQKWLEAVHWTQLQVQELRSGYDPRN